MFWSSHPVCIRCRLPRFCTFSILSILNLMWSWPFFYALLISQLSWFIPCKCSEFFTHILHSLPPHQLSLSYHGAYFTLTFPIPRKFLTSLTFYPQHPINLGAGSGSRRTFFLQCLGRSHIGLDIDSQQIWLWPSQKWPLLDVCTFPKRIWVRWHSRATLRRSSCC